jgi:hypothetical protein
MSREYCFLCNVALRNIDAKERKKPGFREPTSLFRLPNVSENLIRSVLADEFFHSNVVVKQLCCGKCVDADYLSTTAFASLKHCQCVDFDFDHYYTRILLNVKKLSLRSNPDRKNNRLILEEISKDSRACIKHKCSRQG